MLKLRSLGINDYSVLEGRHRIGHIRFVIERMPPAISGLKSARPGR